MTESYQVYVGNLPTNVSKRQLRELFLPLGDVLDIWINRKFETVTYAFVGFADVNTCNEACKRFDNYELGLSKLEVRKSFKNINFRHKADVLFELPKKKGVTKSHLLNLILLKNLRENRDIRESFKMAVQEAEYVTGSDTFEVVKHGGEQCNLETLEQTIIRNFKKPRQKKAIPIDIDLTKGKLMSLEQSEKLFNVKWEAKTTTLTTTTTTATTTATKTKQGRSKIPVSMDYRSACE